MDPLQQNHQDPRQWLQENKIDLCQQLSDVAFDIIEKAEGILTVKEYKTLKGVKDDSKRIEDLLNTIIGKSSEECKEFVQIMQQHCPLYSSSQGQCYQFVCAKEGSNVVTPLVSHTNTGPINMDVTLKASDQLDAHKSQNYSACGQTAPPYSVQAQPGTTSCVTAIRRSNVVAPVFHHANVSGGLNLNIKIKSGSSEAQDLPKKTPECFIKGSPKSAEERAASIPCKRRFLKDHLSKLVQNVKNVDMIVDELLQIGLYKEMASNIRAQSTPEMKMREIILGVGSKRMAEAVVLALCRCQEDVMEELLEA